MLYKKDYLMDVRDGVKPTHSSVDELGKEYEYSGWIIDPFALKRYRVYHRNGGNAYITVSDDEPCC